jgi:hypothetical protein
LELAFRTINEFEERIVEINSKFKAIAELAGLNLRHHKAVVLASTEKNCVARQTELQNRVVMTQLEDPSVKSAAADASDGQPILLEWMLEPQEHFARLGTRDVAELLSDPRIRSVTTDAAHRQSIPSAWTLEPQEQLDEAEAQVLVDQLQDPNWNVRLTAADALS